MVIQSRSQQNSTALTSGNFSFHTDSKKSNPLDRAGPFTYEWTEMWKIMEELNNDYPALGTAILCYLQDDHSNKISVMECKEC